MATVSVEAVQHKLQTSGIQLEQHSGNMFSPDQKSSDGRGAPATPGCAAATNALKRPLSTEDDEPEAAPSEPDDDKPQQKPSRQYAKWSAEEEQIFFLKLQTVSSLELTEGLRSIAQHLPSKSSSQVKDYYYRLRSQFQKLDSDKDVDCLTHKEVFQAMSHMWIRWCKGRKRKHKLAWGLQNKPEKKSRHLEVMQQSLDLVFEAREKKAERQQQRKADRQAAKSKAREAEQQANPTPAKPSKGSQKQTAASQKENCSLASNLRLPRQSQAAKSAVQVSSCVPAIRSRMPNGSRPPSAVPHGLAQLHEAHPEGEKGEYSAQLPRLQQLQESVEPGHQAAADSLTPSQPEQQVVPADDASLTVQHQQQGDLQQQEHLQQRCQQEEQQHWHQQQQQLFQQDSSEQQQPQSDCATASLDAVAAQRQPLQRLVQAHQAEASEQSLAGRSSQGSQQQQPQQPEELQPATDAGLSMLGGTLQDSQQQQQWQQSALLQQRQQQQSGHFQQQQQPEHLQQPPAHLKQQHHSDELQRSMTRAQSTQRELLCLRLRPRDSEARRLLQGLGLKAQLEMPNNKPKKGMGGLLKHLQAKWQQLGDVKQQLRQEGNMLELQYAWLPIQSAAEADAQQQCCGALWQGKQSTSSLVTTRCPQGSCADAFSASASQSQAQGAAAAGDPQLPGPSRSPFGSPLHAVSRHQSGAASSSSSAHVPEEAVNSAQRPDLLQPQEFACREQQPSNADARPTAAAALDLISSVSGLVTPCKAQHSVLQNDHSASCRKSTPSQLSRPQSHHATDWQDSSMPAAAQPCAPTPQSHHITVNMDRMHSQTAPAMPSQVLAEQTAHGQPADWPLPGNHCNSSEWANAQHAQALSKHCSSEQPGQLSQPFSSHASGQISEQSLMREAPHVVPEASCSWDDFHDAGLDDIAFPDSLPDEPPANLAGLEGPEHARPAEHAVPADHAGPAEHAEPAEHSQPVNATFDMFSLPDPLDSDLALLDLGEEEAEQGQFKPRGMQGEVAEHDAGQQQDSSVFEANETPAVMDQLPVPQQSMCTLLMAEESAVPDHQTAGAVEAINDAIDLATSAADCTARSEPCPEMDLGCNTYSGLMLGDAHDPEQPALGVPLLGTVVLGHPLQPVRGRKGARASVRKPKGTNNKSKQSTEVAEGGDAAQKQKTEANAKPKRKRKAPAAAATDGDANGDQPQDPNCPQQEANGPQQPAGKKRRKRPAATPKKRGSPAKLPALSPMALSLKEVAEDIGSLASKYSPPGVKKRRLAKEAETQAAASSDQPFCLQLGTGSDQTHMLEATQQHSDQPDLSAVGEQPPSDPGLIHSQPSGHFSSAPTNDVTHMQSMSSGHMSYIEQQECDAHTAGDCSAALMASQDCVADPQQGTCADAAAAMASQHADCSQHQACYAPDPDHLTGQLQGMPSQQDNIDRLSTDQQCIEMHPQPPSLSPTSASHVQQQHQQLPALSLTSAAHSQQQHQQPARQHLQPQSDEEHQYQELEQQQQQQQCEHQQQQYEHCKVKSQQQNSGGVSFDVRGMDLFQQQDTCDAFGSFWRSTSGAQSSQPLAAAEAGPSGQEQARAVAFEGDISLGCWSADPQVNQITNTIDNRTVCASDSNGVPDQAGAVAAAAVCGQQQLNEHQSPALDSMNLMAYFHTLADGSATCRKLLTPLTGSIKLDTPAQHAQQPLPEPSFESLYCQESSLTLTSTSDEEAIGTQPDSSGLSRQPTAHEIQYMDELDLTDNLGSLLGPGDSWIVPEDAHVAALPERMGTSVGCANGLTACISTTAQVLNDKPFQELFPMSA